MKILQLLLVGGTIGSRIRREDEKEPDAKCVKDHEFEQMCNGNNEEDCKASAICTWCQNSCNVNPDQIDDCLENYESIFECIFEMKKESLAENTGLSKNESKIIVDVISKIPDSGDGNSEARSGFFNMFGSDNMFGMKQEPLIPYEMMSIQNRISNQFITCPVNVPFCQRQTCTSSIGNPQQNAMDCYRIAGCCFDNNLFVYKSAFGGGYFPAPVCYRAIRTPIFHALAEQITMSTDFLPNFLIPITNKVDAFMGDDNRFNLMLEYHQCLSNARMAPSRLRLENYLTQVWPGYIWMRMRPQGDTFLEALVDTLSQTCGWDGIKKGECMMVGCCWSQLKDRCTHPTDLTKIQPQKLIATATWMMTTMGNEEKSEEPEATRATPVTTPPAAGGAPPPFATSPVGLPPGIPPGEESRTGSFDDLFKDLTGRRRKRSAGKRNPNRQNARSRARRQNSVQEARQGLSQVSPIATMAMLSGNQGGNNNMMNTLMMSQMMGNQQGGFGNPAAGFGAMMGNAGLGNQAGGLGNMLSGGGQAGGLASMLGGGGLSNMFGGAQSGGALGNMMGGQSGVMNTLGGLMSGLGNVNNALFQQMGVSNINPFMMGQKANICPKTQAKLNCMAPPADDEKIDALFMINTPKQCEVKGCCWDQSLMQQLLLARKSEGINNIQQFQCPWRAPTVGSKWGLPDLSESLKGCCSISPCVHTELPAEWTLWGEWTQCTKLCGGGESVRSRACIGNGFCPGMTDDTQREQVVSKPCNMKTCEAWSMWAPWGACTASCGQGRQERFRSCTDVNGLDVAPPGISNGCRGNDKSTQPCKLRPCPNWGVWQPWSVCSTTCGMGQRLRRRQCNIPNSCPGPDTEMSQCGSACWATWNAWSDCSKSCYGGQRSRSRDCQFQAETGMSCSGRSDETGKCNTDYCETWVNWQQWSDCTDGPNTCGQGSKIRVRECTGVPGAPGCQGEGVEQVKCSIGTCSWSEWSQMSACSRTCGEGRATYKRICSRPGQCPGLDTQQLTCMDGMCPGFQEWGEWQECDVTCGSGRQQRIRECNGQINVDCRGSTNQVKSCQLAPCANRYNTGPIPNPFPNQWPPNTGQSGSYTGYGQQTSYGQPGAYGNNNWGTSQNPSTSNAFRNLFGQSTGTNNLFGNSAATNTNDNPYDQIAKNPWGALFSGITNNGYNTNNGLYSG